MTSPDVVDHQPPVRTVETAGAARGLGACGGYGSRRLATDLRRLGVPAGGSVLVHCSMRSIGRTADGTTTLLSALRQVLGTGGTLVVPAQTAGNSVSSPAYRRRTAGMDPVSRAAYEATMPGFDPTRTPSEGMGALAEHVRRQPQAVRSAHPQTSFAALGPDAAELMADHALDSHLGERSPLAALYRGDASILLIGVDYAACTALHLAEYRLPWRPARRPYRCYRIENGSRVRTDFLAAHLDDSDFPRLGRELDVQPFVRTGAIGDATSRILPIRATVDFAAAWIAANRARPTGLDELVQSFYPRNRNTC